MLIWEHVVSLDVYTCLLRLSGPLCVNVLSACIMCAQYVHVC